MALTVIINNIYYLGLLDHIVSKINSSYNIFIKQFPTLDSLLMNNICNKYECARVLTWSLSTCIRMYMLECHASFYKNIIRTFLLYNVCTHGH